MILSQQILVLFLYLSLIEALQFQNHHDAESFYGLSDVVANLVTVDNTDPIIISDFDLKQQVRMVFYQIK